MKRTVSASLSTMTSLPSCDRYPSGGTPPRQAPHRGRRVELLRHRDEGGTPGIEDLDDLGKIGERAGQPVDLVDNDGVDPPRREVSQQLLQSRSIRPRAGEPAVIISRAQADPAFLPLALDEGLAGFTLRPQ
jgi:hypothetical protein